MGISLHNRLFRLIFVFFIYSSLLPFIHCENENIFSEIILNFSKNGTITSFGIDYDLLWKCELDRPLIQTHINVKQIDFDKDNVLPGEDGKLYLINSKKEIFLPLNYTIPQLVSESPIALSQYKNGIFYGTKRKQKIWLDVSKGIISYSNPHITKAYSQNDHIIEIDRIDYLFELRINDDIIFWNITSSEFDFHVNKTNISRKNSSHALDMEDVLFSYHYDINNKLLSVFQLNTEEHEMKHIKHNSKNGSNKFSFLGLTFELSWKKIYMTLLLFLVSVIFTIYLFLKMFERQQYKSNATQTKDDRNYNNQIHNYQKGTQTNINLDDKGNSHNMFCSNHFGIPPQPIQQFDLSLKKNESNSENLSQLSTTSPKNNFLSPRMSLSASLSFEHYLGHKYSAPEQEVQYIRTRKLFKTVQHKKEEIIDSISNEEELASYKKYHMSPIKRKQGFSLELKEENNDNIILNKKNIPAQKIRKLSDSIYKPTEHQLDLLKSLSLKYQDHKKLSSSISLTKIGYCETKVMKYFEIYKIINEGTDSENNMVSTDYENENKVPEDIIKHNSNFCLCDTGRFINNFENIQLIDKGGFGTVFKAKHKIDGSFYAIKVIKVQIGLDDDISKIEEVQEIKMMMKVEHTNIVRYITCWFEFEDPCLFEKRGRALSMDETRTNLKQSPKNKQSSSNKKSTSNLKNKVQSNSNASEYELVDNHNNDDIFLHKKINLYDEDNTSYSFSNGNSNINSYNNVNIIFGEEDNIEFKSSCNEIQENDNEQETTNSMRIPNNHSKNRLNPVKSSYPLYFYMQMEYCEGCPLSYYLQNRPTKSEENLILNIFNQMAKALSHIHNKGIIHRDLKPANIFINNCYKVKIGDFGLAAEKKMTKDKVGTFLYQSPEQLENKPYNEKVDIYALGLILLEMCLLFNTETERRVILLNVRKGIYPEELKQLPNEFELVKKMTRNNPSERPSIDEIINSEEISEIADTLDNST